MVKVKENEKYRWNAQDGGEQNGQGGKAARGSHSSVGLQKVGIGENKARLQGSEKKMGRVVLMVWMPKSKRLPRGNAREFLRFIQQRK